MPVNNRFNDLKNQIALAYEGRAEQWDDKLSTTHSIDEIFRQAQREFNAWRKLPAEERTADVPPTFLVQAEDDDVKVENSLVWYRELKDAGVPAEMHLYPTGNHGYGLFRTGEPISCWGMLAGAWFRRQAGLK